MFNVHVFVVVCIHFFVCIFVVVLLFVFVLVLVQAWSRSELCLCRAGPGAEVTGGNWCDEHVWPPAPPALPPSAESREHTHGVVAATNMEHEAHDAWNCGSSATSSSVTNKLSELGCAPLLSAETETNSTFGDHLHFTRHPNPL